MKLRIEFEQDGQACTEWHSSQSVPTLRRHISGKQSWATVAWRWLRDYAARWSIPLPGTHLVHQRTLHSLASTHILFQQHVAHVPVHRAYVTVHVSHQNQVYLLKSNLVTQPPQRTFPALQKQHALACCQEWLDADRSHWRLRRIEPRWLTIDDRCIPTWRLHVVQTTPRQDWILYIDPSESRVVHSYDNLAKAYGRANIFDPNPIASPSWVMPPSMQALRSSRIPDECYRRVTLYGLDASGYLQGKRVTTQPMPTSQRIRRSNHLYEIRSHQKGFEEVMCYAHLDAAIRYIESLGYRGKRTLFKSPLRVHPRSHRQDNSWYSPHEKLIAMGTGEIDDAEDGETLLHEFGHALQDAIVPDFGQSEQAAAIGEGFGDYWAGSFFAERKPPELRSYLMSWDGLPSSLEERRLPPHVRRLDSKETLYDFSTDRSEHANGSLWAALLWEIRQSLGREAADRLIVESHFSLHAFTTFTHAARSLLDCDALLHQGKHRDLLIKLFRKRRIES